MRILGVLQNQYFERPDEVKALYAKFLAQCGEKRRHELNARFLFRGCKTGKVLRKVFGQELCDQIIWAEASPQIGGVSDSVFPPDAEHILSAIELHEPEVVLAFGKVAHAGVAQALALAVARQRDNWSVIIGPHPAARHAHVAEELEEMRQKIAVANATGTVFANTSIREFRRNPGVRR